jgi:two-component system sensor histidine kinase ChvG
MKTVRAVALLGAGTLAIIVTAVMILIVSQVEAGLIDARVQTLLTQGEIIAMAIASQGTESDAINIDPERLLELQVGETYSSSDNTLSGFEFPVNPERVAPLLRRLITPTNTRARIYDRDGTLILDSRNLYGRGDVLRFDLPPPTVEPPGIVERTFIAIRKWLSRGDFSPYREIGPENGRSYPEVAQALDGEKASVVRINDRGEAIILVTVPIQRLRIVRGALQLSTQSGGINETINAQLALKVSIYVLAILLLFVAVFARQGKPRGAAV